MPVLCFEADEVTLAAESAAVRRTGLIQNKKKTAVRQS